MDNDRFNSATLLLFCKCDDVCITTIFSKCQRLIVLRDGLNDQRWLQVNLKQLVWSLYFIHYLQAAFDAFTFRMNRHVKMIILHIPPYTFCVDRTTQSILPGENRFLSEQCHAGEEGDQKQFIFHVFICI